MTDTPQLRPRFAVVKHTGLFKPGTFVCLQGTLGSGKTLGMTLLGYLAWRAGQRVYSNYDTVFSDPIESIKHLFSLRNAVLLIDEMQSIIDSREFKNNVGISQWIVIVRKLGLSILYTTQFIGQVDLRVRHVTEKVYVAEKAKHYGQQATKYTLVDWKGEGGRVVRSFLLPHPQELYGLYDTTDYRVKLTDKGRVSTFDAETALARAT